MPSRGKSQGGRYAPELDRRPAGNVPRFRYLDDLEDLTSVRIAAMGHRDIRSVDGSAASFLRDRHRPLVPGCHQAGSGEHTGGVWIVRRDGDGRQGRSPTGRLGQGLQPAAVGDIPAADDRRPIDQRRIVGEPQLRSVLPSGLAQHALNDHYLALPESERNKSIHQIASHPPKDGDNLVTELWGRHWPKWRQPKSVKVTKEDWKVITAAWQGRIFDGEPGEESQLDQPSELGIDFRQPRVACRRRWRRGQHHRLSSRIAPYRRHVSRRFCVERPRSEFSASPPPFPFPSHRDFPSLATAR